MSIPRGRTFLVVMVTASLLVPGLSAAAAGTGTLSETRDELARADSELAETEAALARAEQTIATAELRVRRAATELGDVEAQLAQAQLDRADAAAYEREVAALTEAANAVLDDVVGQHTNSRDQLEARAISMYKHGPVMPESAMLRGMTSSADWHELAVTMSALTRIVDQERTLVTSTADLTRSVVVGRQEVVAARSLSIAAARSTAEEERRVASLVDRQRAALDAVERERAEHARALAELEQDAEVRAALVRRLTQQLATLELAATRVLVPIDLNLDLHGPPPAWASGLPAAGQPWAATIDAVASRHGVDGRLMASIVWTESNFSPAVVSHAGAIGLAQLMPGTARGLRVDPWDPVGNLDGGTRYIRTQLDRFQSVDLALAAYNAGPNRVQRAGPGIPNIVETQLYVVRVLERYDALAGE